jgi:hypothetical protein
MIPQQSVVHDGYKYLLVYRTSGPVKKHWNWVRPESYEPASITVLDLLRDMYLAQDVSELGPSPNPQELNRLYQVLLAMGGPRDLILRRLGIHEPRKCVDCKHITTSGYPGPRCDSCHEQFVRLSRIRNTDYVRNRRRSKR